MTYVNPHSDLGAIVTMMDGGDASVARLQSAINRVVMNAANDQGLQDFTREMARSALTPFPTGPGVPIPVNGKADNRTSIAANIAGPVAGASIVTTNAAFTEKLEAFSDSRGYPPGDTIAERVLGIPMPSFPKLGLSSKAVAIAAGGALLLAGFFFLRRRSP